MAASGHARLATVADADRITAIYNQGIRERIATFETDERTVATVRSWFSQPYPIVVVEQEGKVIAWAGTSQYRPRSCYAGICEFSVYVDRDYRGAGAGRFAMQTLMDAAVAAGYHKLVSRVFIENVASRRLLSSLGFREVGVYHRHGQLDGIWRDVVIVEKCLDSESSLWHSMNPGQAVTIIKRPQDGSRPDVRYPARLINSDHADWYAFEAEWTLPDLNVHGVFFETGGKLIEYFSPGKPFNIFHVFGRSGDSSGFYANITEPTLLELNHHGEFELVWIDCWLDVVKLSSSELFVLDEDELVASGIEQSDPELSERIRTACETARTTLQSDEWKP